MGVGVGVGEVAVAVGVDDVGVVVGEAVFVGALVGVVVVAGLVVADRVGLPADVGTVPTLVLVAGLVPAVGPTEAVAGDTAWLTDPDGPPVLPVSAGVPPPLSTRASTAAVTPQTATPAPPAMTRRRVNGEARLRCVLDGSSS